MWFMFSERGQIINKYLHIMIRTLEGNKATNNVKGFLFYIGQFDEMINELAREGIMWISM